MPSSATTKEVERQLERIRDGSVEFVIESISARVLALRSTRAGEDTEASILPPCAVKCPADEPGCQ